MAKKSRYATRKEVLSALKDTHVIKGHQKLILIVEYKKKSNKLGVVVGELLQNDKTLLRGKIACFPEKNPESFDWTRLKAGESQFSGYSLDYKSDTVMSMITEGLKKSVKEGRIPFVTK
jgi:hypothetical protein